MGHWLVPQRLVADDSSLFKEMYYASFGWEHDDVIKWKHFPRYWPFVRGIHRSPVNSPHKGQWRGALMFSLIYARIKGWVNNGEAGDLRRYRAHSDVIVMQRLVADDSSLFKEMYYASFGWENGLLRVQLQTIIWTNNDPVHWRINVNQNTVRHLYPIPETMMIYLINT